MWGSMAMSATWASGPCLDLRFIFSLADLDSFSASLGDLVVHQLDSGFDGLSGGALQVWIERGVNAIGLLVDLALRQFADDGVADQIDKIGSIAGLHVWRREFKRSGLGFVRLFSGDGASLNHAVENKIPPFSGALRMAVRREITGPLDDPGEQRGLGQGNVFKVFVEIGARGLGETTDLERTALAEVHPIAIKLEDLLFAEFLFKLNRNQHFRQLALDSLFGA